MTGTRLQKARYGTEPHLTREEAIRSVSLAAMVLMLSASNHGFAHCPIGFAPNLLQEVLRTSDRYPPLMMIAVGRDASINRKRRPRLPVSQVLSFDEFTEFSADKTIAGTRMQNRPNEFKQRYKEWRSLWENEGHV